MEGVKDKRRDLREVRLDARKIELFQRTREQEKRKECIAKKKAGVLDHTARASKSRCKNIAPKRASIRQSRASQGYYTVQCKISPKWKEPSALRLPIDATPVALRCRVIPNRLEKRRKELGARRTQNGAGAHTLLLDTVDCTVWRAAPQTTHHQQHPVPGTEPRTVLFLPFLNWMHGRGCRGDVRRVKA